LLYDEMSPDVERLFETAVPIIKLCLQFGEYEKARALIGTLKVPAGDKSRQTELFMLEGKLSLLTNQYERSIQKYQQAAQLYSELNDKRGLASAYNNLGIIAHEQRQTEPGREYFEKARSLSDYHEDENLKMSILVNLGVVHLIHGESEKALEIFNSLFQQFNDSSQAQLFLLNLNKGLAERDNGDYKQALQSLSKAMDIAKNLNDQRHIGTATFNLAEIHILSGEIEKGNNLLIQAFKIFSNLYDAVRIADTYRVFGLLHMKQGYFELAESELRISLRVNKEKGNTLNLAETYYAYSKLAEKQGNQTDQEVYLRKSLSFCQSMQATRRIERIQEELDALQ
ncbi:MAG: tetratricopeptide repeat protein, partial [Calditrichota bacterium]